MDPLLFTVDYQSSLVCRYFDPDKPRCVFMTKIVGGPPCVMKASKYSAGQLRLLLYGDKYTTVVDVARILAQPPSRHSLIPKDQYLNGKSPWNVFHGTSDRRDVAAALAGDFGDTSDIFVTGSEASGIMLRDLRVRQYSHSILEGETPYQQKWLLPGACGKPSKSLKSLTFAPNYLHLLVLTDTCLYKIDRRKLDNQPVSSYEVPLANHDSAQSFAAARGPAYEDMWPCFIATRYGSLLVHDIGPNEKPAFNSEFKHKGIISAIACHPYNHQTVVMGSSSGLVHIWNHHKQGNQESTPEPITLVGHDRWVWSIDFTKDGEILVTSSSDGTIRAWDLQHFSELASLPHLECKHPESFQRCRQAEVRVGGELVGGIGPGVVALWGIEQGDSWKEAEYCIRKVLNCKLWPENLDVEDENRRTGSRITPTESTGKTWAKSLVDMDHGKTMFVNLNRNLPWPELLVVSQFTLFGNLKKGNKPDFHQAMGSEEAQVLFKKIVEELKKKYKPERIATGAFGCFMQVSLTNDGPVTLVIESKNL